MDLEKLQELNFLRYILDHTIDREIYVVKNFFVNNPFR